MAVTAFPDNLPGLTSVRFVLALGVVLFHYQLQWPWQTLNDTALLNKARLGVDSFFILSGFVLTHAYRDAIAQGRVNYGRFLVARLARIYPAHLVVLAFVGLMVGAAVITGAEFDQTFYDPVGLFGTLLLAHAWTPRLMVAEWNGPSWSLSAEWFAYLAFPLYAWCGFRLRNRPVVLLALAGVTFVIIDQLYQQAFGVLVVHAETNLGILRIIPEFLYGVALYRLGEHLRPSRKVAIGAAIVAMGALVASMHFNADDRLLVALAGPMVLSLALLTKVGADRGISRPWMIACGEASYALYLVHMPILIGWKGVHSALTGQPSTYIFAWWEIGVLLVLTLLASFALHYLIESPARQRIRRAADFFWPNPISKPAMPTGSQPPDV